MQRFKLQQELIPIFLENCRIWFLHPNLPDNCTFFLELNYFSSYKLFNKMKDIFHEIRRQINFYLINFFANNYRFLQWIFTVSSFLSRPSKGRLLLFLYTSIKAFSWSHLVLLFKVLLWKIHTNWQYQNWQFTKVFIRTRLWFMSM